MREDIDWLPEHIDVPIFIPAEEHGVQNTEEDHCYEKCDGWVVNRDIESRMLFLFRKFRIEFDPGLFSNRDNHPDDFVIGHEAIRPYGVFEL